MDTNSHSGLSGSSGSTKDLTWLQFFLDAHAYIAKRQAEYPPMTDWIDGMVKGDQAQIAKYIADCQAVKAKYPK